MHAWVDVLVLLAVPGVRPGVIAVLLFIVISTTAGAAGKFATGLSHRAYDVRAGETARNPDFETPDDHQMRWHITHARDDVSQISLLLGSIYVTLRVILAVLIVGVLAVAL
jgi:hypothetical protein